MAMEDECQQAVRGVLEDALQRVVVIANNAIACDSCKFWVD
jgi:hypothetical protein